MMCQFVKRILPTNFLDIFSSLMIIFLVFAVFGSGQIVLGGLSDLGTNFFPLIIVGLSIALIWLLDRYVKRDILLYTLALIFLMLPKLIWTSMFDSIVTSDYARYYNCAISIVNNFPLECYDHNLFWRRSLVYLALPLRLFGPSRDTVEYYNLIIHLINSILFILIARKFLNRRRTLVSLVLFALYPDFFYALTFPSHDPPGMMWLMAYFLVFSKIIELMNDTRKIGKKVIFSFLAGIILLLCYAQREYHFAAIVVSALYFLYLVVRFGSPYKRLSSILLCIIFPIISFKSSEFILKQFYPYDLSKEVFLLNHLTAMNMQSNDTFSDRVTWQEKYFPILIENDNYEFIRKKVAQDFFQSPTILLKHLFDKTSILTRPTGNFKFSTVRKSNVETDINDSIGITNRNGLKSQIISINLFFLILVLISLVVILTDEDWRKQHEMHLFIMFSIVQLSMFIAFGAAQERYSIFLSVPLCVFAASIKIRFFNAKVLVNKLINNTVLIAILFFLATIGYFALFQFFKNDGNLMLMDLRAAAVYAPSKLEGKYYHEPVIEKKINRVQLSFRDSSSYEPGDYIAFKVGINNENNNCKNISFFISNVATSVPYRQLWQKGELLLKINLDQSLVYSVDVADIDFDLIELSNSKFAQEVIFTLQPLRLIEKKIHQRKQAPFYLDYFNCIN